MMPGHEIMREDYIFRKRLRIVLQSETNDTFNNGYDRKFKAS